MDPIRNPYAPGAGSPPPELAGREELRERVRIATDYDWPAIIDASPLLIDTRNVTAGRDDAHIVRL